MDVSKSLDFITANEAEFDELLAEIQIELGDKKAAELNPYNFADRCGPIANRRHDEQLSQTVQRFTEMAAIIRELVDKKNQILNNLDTTRDYLSQLTVPFGLEAEIRTLLNCEENIVKKKAILERFEAEHVISNNDLKEFMNEANAIDSDFFRIFKRIVDNIELQQAVLSDEFLTSSKTGRLTERSALVETYIVAKRIGMRRLNAHFEAQFQKLIFDGPAMQTCLEFLALNPDTNLSKINQKVTGFVSQNLKQVLDSIPIQNKKSMLASYSDLSPVIDHSLQFILQFTTDLFKKFSHTDVYFLNNIDSIFSACFSYIDAGTQMYLAQTTFKSDHLVIPDALLRIKSTLKNAKPKGLRFIAENMIDSRIDDVSARFKVLSNSYFEKLFDIKNFDLFREQILHAVTQYLSVFRFHFLSKNEKFRTVITDNLKRAKNEFSKHEAWRNFQTQHFGTIFESD